MTSVARGRYALFHSGIECGEERWSIAAGADGVVITGSQEMVAPHPFPNRQDYRLTLSPEWRPTGLEVLWDVGGRRVVSTHHAEAGMWRVRIDYGGTAREQEGDFPDFCEIEYGSHLSSTVILARRDFGLEGEHEFPVLRIGPPLMAVTPSRLLYRCVEVGTFDAPGGRVKAKRYVASLPESPEQEGYAFWADEDGFVLESYEGLDPARPWMRLVELERG